MNPSTWFSLVANAALPAYAAYRYAQFALAPGALVLQDYARGKGEWHDLEFELSDLAWIGAMYFVLRAWSGAHAYLPAFDVRRKGYFQRPWIESVTRLGRKPPSKDDY